MSKIECRLTVYFESPFWVGVYERGEDNRLEVSRIVFGAEPKDYQVYGFLLDHWHNLKFSPPLHQSQTIKGNTNPKRMQREIKRQVLGQGVGTKAQQAIQQQREEGKAARKATSRRRRLEEKDRRFRQKQEKKKEKRKGH